jgi:hypothetical protein
LALVVLATIMLVVASVAVWVNRVALQDAAWTSATTQMVQDPRIRDPLAAYISAQLVAKIDVETQLQQTLPGPTKRLAPLVATTVNQAITQATSRLLAQPAVQKILVVAIRASHTQAVDVLNGKKVKANPDGTVTVSLVPVIVAVAERLGIPTDRLAALPPQFGKLAVLPGKRLSTARTITKWLQDGVVVLVVLTLLLYAAAIWLAVDRRRQVWRVGLSLVIGALLVVLARALIGGYLPGAISRVPDAQTAVRDAWRIISAPLGLGAITTAAVGVIMLLGAWLTGPHRFAVRARTVAGPWLSDPRYAYGGLVVVLLLLIAWGPTPATENPVAMLVAAACAAVGLEAVRRQVRTDQQLLPAAPGAPSVPADAASRSSAVTSAASPTPTGPADDATRPAAGDPGGDPPAST